MLFFEILDRPNGWKYRLVQKDADGLTIQYLLSGGSFRTREQAEIALVGISKELLDTSKENRKISKGEK